MSTVDIADEHNLRSSSAALRREVLTSTRLPRPAGVDPEHHLGHPYLGLSRTCLAELLETYSVRAEATTSEVALRVHLATLGSNKSLCEIFLSSRTLDGALSVGEADIFVSHAHSCTFAKLLSALDNYADTYASDRDPSRPLYFWIDVVSTRRDDLPNIVCEVAAKIGKVVLIIDPWQAPVALSRMWCLFEISQCVVQHGLQLFLSVPREERARFLCALSDDREAVESALVSFDVRLAQTSVEADRLKILGALHERGFENAADGLDPLDCFNEKVQLLLRGALQG